MIKVTTLTTGAPDQLDEWLLSQEVDAAWGEWLELTFDPDL